MLKRNPAARFCALAATACLLGCRAPQPPPAAGAAPAPPPSAGPVAPPEPPPFEQPNACPEPFTWEDGSPIVGHPDCPEPEPSFYQYRGHCCRYRNRCEAPWIADGFDRLADCEREARLWAQEAERLRCEPGQLKWRPELCDFSRCEDGRFRDPSNDFADCAQPLRTELALEPNRAELDIEAQGRIENLVAQAEVIGVTGLVVTGLQAWDEVPKAGSSEPLSLRRARLVHEAVARLTEIPVEVKDGGTQRRGWMPRGPFGGHVSITMKPLLPDHASAVTDPFTLPWNLCESELELETKIRVEETDGDIIVEICRDEDCSRAGFRSSLYTQYPGGMSSVMNGDIANADLSLMPTRHQSLRNRASRNFTEPMQGPADFDLAVSIRGAEVTADATYRLRVFRRRTELALDWSAPIAFRRVHRHPTRDPEPCLVATVGLPPVGVY